MNTLVTQDETEMKPLSKLFRKHLLDYFTYLHSSYSGFNPSKVTDFVEFLDRDF